MPWLRRIPSRVDRVIVAAMPVTGLLLLWVVAAGVKLHLQAQGRPTWPWSAFATYAVFGLFASAIAAAPLTALAVFYRSWIVGGVTSLSGASPLQRRLVVLSGFAGCVAGMVRVFVDVFWEFDPVAVFFIAEIVAMFLPWMAGGLVVGALLAAIAGLLAGSGPSARPPPLPPRAAQRRNE
jgi:hypothetical protein